MDTSRTIRLAYTAPSSTQGDGRRACELRAHYRCQHVALRLLSAHGTASLMHDIKGVVHDASDVTHDVQDLVHDARLCAYDSVFRLECNCVAHEMIHLILASNYQIISAYTSNEQGTAPAVDSTATTDKDNIGVCNERFYLKSPKSPTMHVYLRDAHARPIIDK